MTGETRRPGPAGAFRIGRVLGAGIFVRPGLVVMGAALVLLLGPRFERSGTDDPYLVAFALIVALYVSVLLHEIAHVVVARSYGMDVASVTLHLLGGETLIEGESRSARQELLTAGSGPLASLLVGLAALGVAGAAGDGTASTVWWSIGWVNVIVAGFNLLPGLPLDGGRVLRAIIWAVTGRELTGIRVAAWIGRVAAVAATVFGAVRAAAGGAAGYLDLAVAGLVSVFLWQGASQALRVADRAGRIESLVASRLAVDVDDRDTSDLPRLPSDLGGVALLRAITRVPADTYLLVDPDGHDVGLLRRDDLSDAYREGSP
ncbi:peptidase, M50 family [Aeromicrobium marinum DSM 15272]|uniref:Peptidase, M50 family n=1 Tax=Aeromicrobium marinum DSM 15272 TaxID=585531 RepID=E2S9W6_9ACTN|nr:M50 family metallopeptidase [Aeromicrobium marinum]EFQ84040.1 peptidase, M50 family [Aeromicrobium marinum DSM 15272]